jgi:hypothetical protein
MTQEEPLAPEPDELDESHLQFLNDLALFVGENSDYYLRKWYIIANTGRYASWNWAAFLVPWVWLAYRKMYVLAALLLLIQTMGDIVLADFYTVLWLVCALVCGLFGNYVYYLKASRRVMRAQALTFNPNMKTLQLLRQGGTTWWGMIIMTAILFLILWLVCPGGVPPYDGSSPEGGI